MASCIEKAVTKTRSEIYSTLVRAHKQKRFAQITMNGEGVFKIYPTKGCEDSITLEVKDTEELVSHIAEGELVVDHALWPSQRARITFTYSNPEHKIRTYLRMVWEGSHLEGSWKFNERLLLSKLDKAIDQTKAWRKQDEDRRKTIGMFLQKVKGDFGDLGEISTSYSKQTWEQIAVIAWEGGQLTLTSLNCGETYRVTSLQTKGELKGSKIKSIIEQVG